MLAEARVEEEASAERARPRLFVVFIIGGVVFLPERSRAECWPRTRLRRRPHARAGAGLRAALACSSLLVVILAFIVEIFVDGVERVGRTVGSVVTVIVALGLPRGRYGRLGARVRGSHAKGSELRERDAARS